MRPLAAGVAALAFAAWLAPAAAQTMPSLKIVGGPEGSTSYEMARDLARFVAPGAEFRLDAIPTAGSVEELPRLRAEPGVKFAIAQQDVFQAFLDQMRAGNADATATVGRLRAVTRLHAEEVHFVVRADAGWSDVRNLRDARINVGPIGSGSAVTATEIYRRLFGATIPAGHASFLPPEEALLRLVDDRSIDVVVVVSGQPAPIFTRMQPAARKLVRLLPFGPAEPASAAAPPPWEPATIRASSYPNLLSEDVPAVAVPAWLLTFDFDRATTIELLEGFARSLCANLPRLREQGHPKWRDVKLSERDGPEGWSYYLPMARVLSSCVPTVSPPRQRVGQRSP